MSKKKKAEFVPLLPTTRISTYYLVREGAEGVDITDLLLCSHKPSRNEEAGIWGDCGSVLCLPHEAFPQITWECEPVAVEITLKPIKL